MGLSKKPYKGTRDFFPTDKRIRDYLFNTMKEVAESFGHEPYDGPLLEEIELYKAKSGEELVNEQLYSFYDRGEREVAIRPEMTPTLARMVAQIHREVAKPIRYYSFPVLMRYERPQRGRLREHFQFNADVFGAPPLMGEIEILAMIVSLFKKFGANENHFEILVNGRHIVDGIFKESLKLAPDALKKLYQAFDKAKKLKKNDLDDLIKKIQLPTKTHDLCLKYLELKSFEDVKSFLQQLKLDHLSQEVDHFMELAELSHLRSFLKYDPAIVRGLDYYAGFVFEAYDKHPDNRRALCGGGAYPNLLKIFNETPLPGVGFGLGDVTLKDFLETHELLPDFSLPENDLYITFQIDDGLKETLSLAQELREHGLKILTHFEPIKIKKALNTANKKGARFISFLGSDEVASNEITLKDLKTGQQEKVTLDGEQIAHHIKGHLG